MKRGLFILHEGIGDTIFRSQVLEHVIAMEKNYKIKIDILSFETHKKQMKTSERNLHIFQKQFPNIDITLKRGLNKFYPFSFIVNLVLLYIYMRRNGGKYEFIHGRTNYTAFLSKLVCKNKEVIWDCRGDSLSELKLSLSSYSIFHKLYGYFIWFPFERLQIKYLCKKANSGIFVSQDLFDLYQKNVKFERYEIIPCLVNESKFYFDANLREQKRKDLKIPESSKVFLYSGSMVKYQAIELQKVFIQKVISDKNNFILYITSDIDYAKEYFKDLLCNRFIITRVSFDEINSYYNASDFAILLRENRRLNKVASPTKFGEYCMTGVKVVLNDTVAQAVSFSQLLGNYVSFESNTFNNYNDCDRKEVALNTKQLLSRNSLAKKYIRIYEQKKL
ncbi:MAG: hypothetical protein KGV54_00575 [Oceanivirga sp.]|nr:hypothetical protein [Oceanivirga sp.]